MIIVNLTVWEIVKALRFSRGFQLDDSNVGLDEIHNVVPGKGYVSAPITLKKYETGYYASRIFPRSGKDLPVPEDVEELIWKGEEFIGKWEKKQ